MRILLLRFSRSEWNVVLPIFMHRVHGGPIENNRTAFRSVKKKKIVTDADAIFFMHEPKQLAIWQS